MDIGRIKADTGYQPEYLPEKSFPDYIDWLRSGNAE
jgi:nucleoside-diphosphate-sugar epimerase